MLSSKITSSAEAYIGSQSFSLLSMTNISAGTHTTKSTFYKAKCIPEEVFVLIQVLKWYSHRAARSVGQGILLLSMINFAGWSTALYGF